MGQKPAELTPDVSPWHAWGAHLRATREARGLSLADLGAKIHVSVSQLSKVERAQRSAPRALAAACDSALDLAGALVRTWDAADSQVRTGATSVGRPRVHVSNGIAHVSNPDSDLAASGIAPSGSEDDDGVVVPCRLRDGRMSFVTVPRRAFLGIGAATAFGMDVSPEPASVRLRNSSTYGATPVEHFNRLRRHLIESDNLLGPRHVIPAVRQNIQTIRLLRDDSKGVDQQALMELQTQLAEFAGWLYQDLGDFGRAEYWLDRALQWSHVVGDPELTSFVLARRAQLAGDTRNVVEVIDMAKAAQTIARPRSRLAAVGQTYEGYGHALRGDSSSANRAFDEARAVAEESTVDPSPWGGWLDASYIEIHRSYAQLSLGEYGLAAEGFAVAIDRLPDGYDRDRGVYLSRQAISHARAGAPERAAHVGMQALRIAQDTGSGRILHELVRLDDAVMPWRDLPPVVDLREAVSQVVVHESN
jgi:tetratricopeptide (TPR) repeat protein